MRCNCCKISPFACDNHQISVYFVHSLTARVFAKVYTLLVIRMLSGNKVQNTEILGSSYPDSSNLLEIARTCSNLVADRFEAKFHYAI